MFKRSLSGIVNILGGALGAYARGRTAFANQLPRDLRGVDKAPRLNKISCGVVIIKLLPYCLLSYEILLHGDRTAQYYLFSLLVLRCYCYG